MTLSSDIRTNRNIPGEKLLWLLMLACVLSKPLSAEEMPALYSSIPAVDCVINPYRVADLASPVAGVIETLYVERSQQVSAGQVVAQLEAGVERANVELARFRSDIESEIRLGQVNLDFDQRQKQRVDTLYDKQVVSIENIDEASREAGLSKWKLEQARELSSVRKLELQRAEEQLEQKSIRAPFDGYVLDTFKYRGEYVEDQAILRLAQLDPLVVEAIVPMENFGEIRVGMQAEVMPEVLSDEKLRGKVTIVDRIGDTASNTFGVRLVMSNPENQIPAGLKCVVKFLEQGPEQIMSENHAQEDSETTQDNTINAGEASLDANEAAPVQVAHLGDDLASVVVAEEIAASEITPEASINMPEEPPPEESNDEAMDAGPSPRGYLVLTSQAETRQQTRELMNRLREAGISDLQEMVYGPYKGLIALGLYSTSGTAEKQKSTLEQLGFEAFIRERY